MGELTGSWASRSEIDAEIRKSAAAGERLVRTTCIRRTLTSRDDMSCAERFAKGNAAFGMTSTFVEVWMDEAALRDLRDRLLKSNPAALIALDAGRIFESDLLAAIPDAMEAEAAEAALEPLRKSAEPEPHAFVRDGDGSCLSCFRDEGDALHRGVKKSQQLEPGSYPSVKAEFVTLSAEQSAVDIVKSAYGEAARDGMLDLKKAAAELNELTDRIAKGR